MCIGENHGDWQKLKVNADPNLTNRLIKIDKPAKYLYKLLLNNKNNQPFERADKWALDLNEEVLDFELYEVLLESYRCTKSVELRSFIYRFAMRDLYPYQRLHKMKLADDPLCPKCKAEDETIIHMFWSCKTATNCWKEVLNWLNDELDTKSIELNPKYNTEFHRM